MKLKTHKTPGGETITLSSGNVFADLGLPNPEEHLLKSNIAIEIRKLIEAKSLTQAEAARLVGLSQPKVSDILRGRLAGYSVERLLAIVNRLGRSVEVRISAQDIPVAQARITVTTTMRASRSGELKRARPKAKSGVRRMAPSEA